MRRMLSSRHLVISVFAFAVAMVCGLQAADRPEVTFADARIFPESLTSTKNGDLYFGSLGQDSVYRATSKVTQATTWIKPKSNGLTTVLGVLADEKAGVLWVCTSASGGRNGQPYVGETALKAFNLKDASFKASYAFPGNGLLPVPFRRARAILPAQPPSRPGRPYDLHGVPFAAQRLHPPGRRHLAAFRERELLSLPFRSARSLRLRARGLARGMHHLPHRARLGQRQAVDGS